jgi:hypothetical protein
MVPDLAERAGRRIVAVAAADKLAAAAVAVEVDKLANRALVELA